MNPEHMTPIKCDLCGKSLDINNIYPGSLCWSCWNGKRFSDKYCCSIRDINKEKKIMDANDVKMIVIIPESGKGEIYLGLTWPDTAEATHRVVVTRTSSCPIRDEEKPFVSKHKIPIQSLGGLLQKISEAVTYEIIVDFLNNEDLGDYIMIEIYDDYRE